MLATIETEHLMEGDSIDLSAIFLGRHLLVEEVLRRYADGQHPVSMRGMAPTTLRLLQRYGAMPFTSYRQPEDINMRSLANRLQHAADHHRAHRRGVMALEENINKTLDDAIGPVPSWVFMLGCQYTYLEFAHSVCQRGEYTALTSFTHHPFGSKFVLEVPDNNYGEEFLNVPIDTLMTYIDHALRTRHPVCWEGDTSEPGFGHGIAVLPKGHKSVTQDSRQRMFDHFDTTDNHCMAIIGLAHDDHGKKYYICKNSWGKNTAYGGYVYMEEDYLKAKTIAVVIPSKAIYNQP
jgi:bleomycin hydrolase